MTVHDTVKQAQAQVVIRVVIIWNPFVKRALFVGFPTDIPKNLRFKRVMSYRYDKDKQRIIIRINTEG